MADKGIDKVGRAMFALWDHLKSLGHPFNTWPEDVKVAVGDALIADDQTITDQEMARFRERHPEFFARHDEATDSAK